MRIGWSTSGQAPANSVAICSTAVLCKGSSRRSHRKPAVTCSATPLCQTERHARPRAGCGCVGDVYAVSAELLIVVQHRPGNRIMVRADAEEAPETQDRVGDAAAGFIDHTALDLTDALTVRVIDRSSFDAVACDQGGCSSVLRHGRALHCGHHSIVSSIAPAPGYSHEHR